ncbi:MAG: hypothetical protein JO253_07200 [Alphaproteobacteria bacterium]|nr:hypothetical protein [Alphaproteobacteria bacterium]
MPRKKKTIPMNWRDVPDVKITPRQWADITRYMHLPTETRSLIERMLSHYRYHKNNQNGYQTKKEDLAEIHSLEKKVASLKHGLSKVGERTYFALLDSTGNMAVQDKCAVWDDRIAILDDMLTDLKGAERDLRAQKQQKHGPKSSALDILAEQLDQLVKQHLGHTLDRGSQSTQFLARIIHVVDPDITDGTLDAALKRITSTKSKNIADR